MWECMKDFFEKYFESYKDIPNLPLAKYNLQDIYAYGLDLKVKFFLENYYTVKISLPLEFEKYLSLWQYEALINIFDYAKNNTLYYSALDIDSSFEYAQLKTITEDKLIEQNEIINKAKTFLHKVPFTQAADIVADNMKFLAIAQDEIEGVVSVETSGTSLGSHHKKRIFCSDKDFESTIQFFFFGMQYLLKNQEDRVALLMSGERVGSIGHLFSIAMERLNIPCKIIGFTTDYKQIAHELKNFEATCVVAIPWHILNISSYIAKNKISHCIKKVLLSGDTASKALKYELSQNLSCEVFNHYGITEFGFAGAVECMEHKALHLRALDLYVEIIDENLNPVEDGLFGEIVITTLTREAMPLIRYRTGDRGRIVPQKCSCASLLPNIEVYGRISQGVEIDKENFIHLAEFQDFFYRYSKIKVNDFDLCVFTDKISTENILLIGIDFLEENDKDLILQDMKKDFAKVFSLNVFNNKKIDETIVNNEKKINFFHFCTMSEYIEIFRKNILSQIGLENSLKECSTQDNFDILIKAEENKKKLNIVTAKKSIRTLSGKID